jgi:hypothetical protein
MACSAAGGTGRLMVILAVPASRSIPQRRPAAVGRVRDHDLSTVPLLAQVLETGLEDLEEAHRLPA